jgi:putative endonuclease
MWFVYILRCADSSLYTGITTNPEKRLLAHLNGTGGAYTRSHKPIGIVFLEKLQNKSQALKRESEIKKLSKNKKESLIKTQI